MIVIVIRMKQAAGDELQAKKNQAMFYCAQRRCTLHKSGPAAI